MKNIYLLSLIITGLFLFVAFALQELGIKDNLEDSLHFVTRLHLTIFVLVISLFSIGVSISKRKVR